MEVKWTEEQQKVIELDSRNILVSAAAGSGKTAVLVERIIRKLTRKDHPADVDRMLIVTFTEAAAAEMKERIRGAIEKAMEERPGDLHLEQQSAMIHTAPITTIHSFCLSVIKEHFHVIGMDPGFRIAEEGELKLLKQDVMDELLEECYAQSDRKFLDFTERFGTGKDDRKIEEIIQKLYEYSRSYPRPDQWLDACVDSYRTDVDEEDSQAEPERSAGRMSITGIAEERVRSSMEDMCRILESGLEICEEPDGPYMYADMLVSDLEECRKVENSDGYDRMFAAANSFAWKRLSSKKDDSVCPEKKEAVKKIRDQAKKLLKDICQSYLYASREVWQKNMKNASCSMEMIRDLVKRFSVMFAEKKRSRNVIDFNDMEHFALDILTEEKGGRLVPSHVACEYQERFEEVMIDEYQDSNLVQETILTSVSRVSKGDYNTFMVGDVKQSIYSFRLSRPELFMEKYNTYSQEESEKQRIDLHKNFRSRRQVLDSVNYIFRQIMKKDLGGIEYDESASLYPGAQFPESDSCQTELLLFDRDNLNEENERKTEARMIARRIREMLTAGEVIDKETGKYRRVRYGDIVILTRSIQGWAEQFSSVLAEEGIPACSVSREGYFETYEVSVLLDYLKILDNARQDLPLAAVLTSCFGNMKTEELAQIRIAYPNLLFYEAVRAYADEAEEGEKSGKAFDSRIRKKLLQFFEQTEYFRKKVSYTPIHDLLSEIIDLTGYGIYITAMPGGRQRAANVEMLVEKAAAFEGTSYKGLFNFVRYIEQLRKYEVDYGEAGIMDEQADTVRIMSVHKSKGLEFPVVFAAGMSKRFNLQDTKAAVILHPEWGAGIDDINLERRTKTPTFLKKIMQDEIRRGILAEEQRILYVALTRAKEKLIMTGQISLTEFGESQTLTKMQRAQDARCYLDWILAAVLTQSSGFEERQEEEKEILRLKPDAPVNLRIFQEEDLVSDRAQAQADEMALDVLEHWDNSAVYVPQFKKNLEACMDYVYPYTEEGKMKLKFTVSELKKYSVLTEEAGQEMYEEPETVPLIPRFLKMEEEVLTGASRGSAYHKLLELLDFTAEYDETSLSETVSGFVKAGRLTKDMEQSILAEDILRFLNCGQGRRMASAAKKKKLFREQPFVLSVRAEQIYPEDHSGEHILVQGIIDVYYEEDDGLVVLDYKTDRVKHAAQLKEKYHAQLDYYAKALEQLLEKPVKEKVIYSFTLGEVIRV